MPGYQLSTRPPGVRAQRSGSIEYRLLLAATFSIFLVIALAARLSLRRGDTGAAAGRRSILDEARERAHGTVPFAFMG